MQVVAEFARTAMSDFNLEGLLADLATAVVDVLDIDGAGVSYLNGEHVSVVHALPPLVVPVERVQEDDQEGPCHDAVRTRSWVVEGELAEHSYRWPRFAERALEAGLHAVASLPLVGREQVWGAIDLYRKAPGGFSTQELSAAQVLADVACGYVVMAHDRGVAVTAQQQAVRALREAESAEQRAAHAATHDGLTGLANRSLLQDRLQHAVATSTRNATALAVVFLDLDGFKEVNDTHGHHAGDELLRQVAARLSGVVREGDTLARWGGDEFVVVCESLHPTGHSTGHPAGAIQTRSDTEPTGVDEHVLDVIVQRLQECFETPFVLPAATSDTGSAVQVQIGASFGVAASTLSARTGQEEGGQEEGGQEEGGQKEGGQKEGGHEEGGHEEGGGLERGVHEGQVEALLRNADRAMYRAKTRHRRRGGAAISHERVIHLLGGEDTDSDDDLSQVRTVAGDTPPHS